MIAYSPSELEPGDVAEAEELKRALLMATRAIEEHHGLASP